MSNDIRKKFSKILKQYGHEIVYIRRNLRFRCECYSERSRGLQKSFCSKCFGTGYVVSISKYLTRRNSTISGSTLPNQAKQEEYGNTVFRSYVYYLEHNSNPKPGDLILEVDWDRGLPKKIREKYFISDVLAKQGEHGRIEFYQVYCRTQPKGESDHDALTQH